MSKGSKSRPRSVDQKTFDSNWDKIFAKSPVEQTWDHYSDLPSPAWYQQSDEQRNEKCNG